MNIDLISKSLDSLTIDLSFKSLILRILMSAIIATIIGCERATKRHAAGVRTFVVVSLANTFAMIIDCYLASKITNYIYILSASSIIAVSTIAVNCILYSSKNQIKGLTTSAALWASGVLGLAAGAGLFTLTLIGFILLIICLAWMPYFERDLKNKSNYFEVHLELKSSQYLQNFITTIRKLNLSIDDIESNPAYSNSGLSVYSIALSIHNDALKQYKTHSEIIDALASLDYIYHIEEMNS